MNDRRLDYKYYNIHNQELRRAELLEEQKRERENEFDKKRTLDELFTEDDSFESMDCSSPKTKTGRKLGQMLMFSEWLKEVPIDLEEKWVFRMCPVGKRCLIRAAKGRTQAFSKGGKLLINFSSLLPSGNKNDHCKKVTILDCILDETTKTFFILDVLCWKSRYYIDCDTGFRFFWIKSKITEEIPELTNKEEEYVYSFEMLDYQPADSDSISTAMSINNPYNTVIDGVLFYHTDTLYTPGRTPLVGWLKPFMIPELLGPSYIISQQFMQMKPENYKDAYSYMDMFDEQYLSVYNAKKNFNCKDVELT